MTDQLEEIRLSRQLGEGRDGLPEPPMEVFKIATVNYQYHYGYSVFLGSKEGSEVLKNPLLNLDPLLFTSWENHLKPVQTSSKRL